MTTLSTQGTQYNHIQICGNVSLCSMITEINQNICVVFWENMCYIIVVDIWGILGLGCL